MTIVEQINRPARAELSVCQCYSLLERHQFISGIFIQFLLQILFYASVLTYQLFFHFNLVLLGFKTPLKIFCRPERRKRCSHTIFYFTASIFCTNNSLPAVFALREHMCRDKICINMEQ